MMKIVERFFTCVFLINCASYVISYGSTDEVYTCSDESQCRHLSNIACPSGLGCCELLVNGRWIPSCVNLNKEPANCIDNPLLYDFGVTSLRHGKNVSDCDRWCSCYNGNVTCRENSCTSPIGVVLGIVAAYVVPPIIVLACAYGLISYFDKDALTECRGQKNTHTKVDNPPSYRKAVRMPLSISETIADDSLSLPTYDEAVNIA